MWISFSESPKENPVEPVEFMEGLVNTFLLLLMVLVGLLAFMLIPQIPVSVLTIVASILLAAGVWWHYTQFAVDYRMSTWQEQLRNYASYTILLVVILLSYAFYVFGWSSGGGSTNIAKAVTKAQNSVVSQISNITRNLSANSPNFFVEPAAPAAAAAPEEAEEPASPATNLFNFLASNTRRRNSNILA
jgi:predicted PurR-regulated permease PerM